MTIPIYGLSWHLHQSPALRELVISPLSPYLQFEQIGWDGYGTPPRIQTELLRSTPLVFFQVPPPESIYHLSDARIVWIPMWDQARGYDIEWWQRLPKNLRVLSFSNEISRRSRSVGLNTLDVRYFMSPDKSEPSDWGKARSLFYWNRTGMVGEVFLRKFCKALDVEVLFFRRRIDPMYSSRDYALPRKIGKTIIVELKFDGANAHREYLKYLSMSNIFIAPRVSEGVGLSFIEALAKGGAVFAYDAPTMNEYITHKTSGYLLRERYKSVWNVRQENLARKAQSFFTKIGYKNALDHYPVTEWQNWAEIKRLDLHALGAKALQKQVEGYAVWQSLLPQYASFISDW